MRTQLVVLPVMAALIGCADSSRKGVALDSGLERYIPADATVLSGIRFRELKNTPLYKRFIEEQRLEQLDAFSKRTGLDPRRDLDEFLFASTGKDILMLARGRIEDQAALEATLEKEGAQRVAAGRYHLLVKDEGAVVFLDKRIALAGRTGYLRQVLESEAAEGDRKKLLLTKVADLPEESQIWAVAIGGFAPVPLPETGNLANLNRVFQSLETTTLSLDLRHGINLEAKGLCATQRDAKQLHDALRGMIGFGRLSTPSDKPELLRFFDSIKVEAHERNVRIEADVPMDLLNRFLDFTGQRRPAV